MRNLGILIFTLFLGLSGVAQDPSISYPYNFTYTGNPYATHIRAADPSARVWADGKLWVYASHDQDNATDYSSMDGYHVYSTSDLVNWTDHGEILHSRDVSWGISEGGWMWAPDCAYKNGKYYLYFPHKQGGTNNYWRIGVAVSDKPEGPFVPQPNFIQGTGGTDPFCFIDDDGQAYLYFGSHQVARLKPNMTELAESPRTLNYGHDNFQEGAYMHKRNGKYYYSWTTFSDPRGTGGYYAMGDSPYGPFQFKGKVADGPQGAQDHHSIVEFKDQWYYFYHRGGWNGGSGNRRNLMVDYLCYNEDGTIKKVEYTQNGVGPAGTGPCPETLQPGSENIIPGTLLAENFSNQSGVVEENSDAGGKHIGFINNGDWSQYAVEVTDAGTYSAFFRIASGSPGGNIQVMLDGNSLGTLNVSATGGWQSWSYFTMENLVLSEGAHTIRFNYSGADGFLFNVDQVAFQLTSPNGGGNGDSFIQSFTYPTGAGQAFASDKYDVYVKVGNGPEQKLQVLMSDVNYRTMYDGDWMKAENKDRTFSFVHLDYDVAGPQLTFRVVKKFGVNSSSAVISPKSYGYTPNLTSGKELTFKVNSNNKYISVNFKGSDNESPNRGWIKNMLCIFVDQPETGKPSKTGAGVVVYSKTASATSLANATTIYFPKGYHNLRDYTNGGMINSDGLMTIKSGQSLYFEGGAFIEGVVQRTAYQDVDQKIYGRGILTGRQYYWDGHPNSTGKIYDQLLEVGNNAEVKGIMYMESPNHGLTGRNVHVENVKFLGWHANHDGVRVGGGSEIHNSFFRAVDDHFYNFGIHVHDCVLWAGHNGSIMTYGWGGGENSNNYAATGSIMENIDIINPEWTNLGNNNGLIMAQVGYNHPINGTTIIRNIRMEGTIPGITNLKPRSSGAGNTAVQVHTADVTFLGDLILENITVEAQFQKGLIRGEADPDFNGNKKWLVKDVLLKNVSIGGTCVNDNNKDQFFNIDYNTIQNVVFNCGTNNQSPEDIDDLAAESLSCTSIKLSWSDVNNETGYRVRRKTESTSYVILQDIPANSTTFTDETAEENVSYTYMVRPLDGSTAVATSNTVTIPSGTCPAEVLLPVNSWDNISEGQVLSGLVDIKTLAYDPNYGTAHGDGIQQINYQIFNASDLSNPLDFVPVTEAPFYWTFNTEDYPNGEYQLRAGAISQDPDERKWTVINVKISNVITGNKPGQNDSGFEVYPNPSNGKINLSKESNWSIQNLAGQMLRSGTGKQADISDLQGGTYLLFTEYGIDRIVKY